MRKICVYFRDMPSALSTFASANKMTIIKDGVYPIGDVRAPRATIQIEPMSPGEDRQRAKRLTELLAELEKNNQIVAFK